MFDTVEDVVLIYTIFSSSLTKSGKAIKAITIVVSCNYIGDLNPRDLGHETLVNGDGERG